MLIACDGLTEQMSNERVMQILTNELNELADPAHALANLFEECLTSGSEDNMSAILVEFMDGGNYGHHRTKTWVPGPLFRARRDQDYVRAYLKDAAKWGVKDGIDLRRTAYEQDIREIKKTTNNSVLILKIQEVIANLKNSVLENKQSKRPKIWKSQGVPSKQWEPSVLVKRRSHLPDIQWKEPTVSYQNDVQKFTILQTPSNAQA